MQGYKEYKETGLAWLERIPKHWKLEKIGTLFSERREKVSDKDFAPLSVTKFGVVPQLDSAAKSNDGDNRKKVVAGDFVINSRSDRKGSSGFSALTGSVSLINIALAPRDASSSAYLHYLLKSHNFIEEYYRNGRGIVADLWTTRFSEMKTIQLPLPPREEQDNIIQFLDHKLEKIHKFIANKQKLIALLEEQKQAIINQAVTKGLDPNAPMKHSGIDWLGEVPKHWKLSRLQKITTTIKTGGTPANVGEQHFAEKGLFWYTPGDFGSALYLSDATKCLSPQGEQEIIIFPAGVVLMIGIGATMGKVSISPSECSCNQQINAIICKKEILNTYLTLYLENIRKHVFATAKYTTLPILNQQETKNILVPVPSISEQNSIVSSVSVKLVNINLLISKYQKEIDLIQEYKTSLISSVVTGQVDVYNLISNA